MSSQLDLEEAPRRRNHLFEELANRFSISGSKMEEGGHSALAASSNHNSTTTSAQGRRMEEAPRSRGLPLTHKHTPLPMQSEMKLIHPILHRIPLQVRFIFNGILGNVLFMIVYNSAVARFHGTPPSTIYSIVYLIFIPLGHTLCCVLVFGWPERYIPSLMSNFPIGLTAIAIGGALTAYLDQIQFNSRIEDFIRDNFTFSHMPTRPDEEQSEFYSSIAVLAVTSIWTYVLSVYINSPPTKSDKKEL